MSVERRPVKAGPCEGCPAAGNCAACPLRTPTTELSSDSKFNSVKSFVKNFGGSQAATIFFNAGGEVLMRLKEKICSTCNKAASTCSHSKTSVSPAT